MESPRLEKRSSSYKLPKLKYIHKQKLDTKIELTEPINDIIEIKDNHNNKRNSSSKSPKQKPDLHTELTDSITDCIESPRIEIIESPRKSPTSPKSPRSHKSHKQKLELPIEAYKKELEESSDSNMNLFPTSKTKRYSSSGMEVYINESYEKMKKHYTLEEMVEIRTLYIYKMCVYCINTDMTKIKCPLNPEHMCFFCKGKDVGVGCWRRFCPICRIVYK